MSSPNHTDLALVAPLTICEVIRSTIVKAKHTLEAPASTQEERERAISYLERIYDADPTTRTTYHYASACYLLAMYSTDQTKERKVYAKKCLVEARKKLKQIETDGEAYIGEHSVTIQIFKGLQKMAIFALDLIGMEVRSALLAAGGTAQEEFKSKESKPNEAGYVRKVEKMKSKKKKDSWGGYAFVYGDAGGDDDDYKYFSDEDYDYHEDEHQECEFPEMSDDPRITDTKWV